MILGRKTTPQNLAEWLNLAIGELAPSAQARVRVEIEAHYNEAVQRHLREGSPDSEAHAAALAELGDAYAAGKRLRREHLTDREARTLTVSLNPNRICTNILFQGLLMVFMFLPNPREWTNVGTPRLLLCVEILLSQILIGGATTLAASVIARRKATVANARKITLLACLNWSNVCLLVVLDGFFMPPSLSLPTVSPAMSVIFLSGYFFIIFSLLRLHKKLRGADENDLRPGDTTAAA